MSGDPYYDNVGLLLHCDGTNGSTTITDSSPSTKTVTAVGNAQISTTQSKYGGASGVFDGTSDYFSVASSTDFDLGTSDFTIECWFYISGNSAPDNDGLRGASLFNTWPSGATITGYALNISGSSTTTGTGLALDSWSTTAGNGTLYRVTGLSISQNAWHHVAAVVSAGTRNIFLDGTLLSGSTTTIGAGYTQFNSNANGARIGATLISLYPLAFNGYGDEIRITKGIARYTSSFAPPIEAFGDSLGVYGLSSTTGIGASTTAHDLPQTGQVITSANGTTVANASVAQSGQAIASTGGVAPAALDLTPSGLAITSQQGTFAEVLNGLFLALTGQSFTSASGTPIYDLASALAGFQVAVGQGSVSAFVEIFVALTGLESASVEGAITALVSKVLSGSTSTLSEGILIPGKGFSLTGKQLTLSKGTPRHSVQIGATGYELAFSGGQIGYSVPLGSHLLTASKGAIKAVNDKTLSGSAIQVDAGATIAALSKMAVGQSITVERGDTVATFTKSLANNLIIMAGKGEIVFDSRDVTVAMVGKTITTSEGTIYIGADKWYNFTRVLAGGTDVTIVHLA